MELLATVLNSVLVIVVIAGIIRFFTFTGSVTRDLDEAKKQLARMSDNLNVIRKNGSGS